MTAPDLSPAEAARVAEFDAAVEPAEVTREKLRLAEEALGRVLALHRPVSQNYFAATAVADPVDVCAIDNTTAWPCRTARAAGASRC